MFRKTIHTPALAALVLGFTAQACTSDGSGFNNNNTPDSGVIDMNNPDASVLPEEDAGMMMTVEFPESSKAVVRFKRTERLKNDFATALGLDPNLLCRELGQYSCTDFVHTIALGGVEPYNIGIREGLEFTTITTPNAVERVALAGCEQRVTKDLADEANALIFKGLGVDNNLAIPDLDAPGFRSSIDTLYKRAVQRPVRDSEVDHLRKLYRDIEATNEPGPARDWAILACFSVMTTMEALFY